MKYVSKLNYANIKEILQLCEARKVKLEYLPPYSPDFNPIEYSFSVIKNALRKNGKMNENENLMQFAEKVLKIAQEVVTPEIAKNQFRHCNISV
jgi:transposase